RDEKRLFFAEVKNMRRHTGSLTAVIVTALSLAVALTLGLAGCNEVDRPKDDDTSEEEPEHKVDDWEYDPDDEGEWRGAARKSARGSGSSGKTQVMGLSAASSGSAAEESDDLGFAVGGAKDVNNMRDNVEGGFLPLPTDITAEGLFYDYYFDTGKERPAEHLFEPSYSRAVSSDPVSGARERYLSVGLNSNLKAADFDRKDLNLVVVLDISGSMSSAFDRYYYDGTTQKELPEEERDKTKMAVARESLLALLDHLRADDRLGIVLFNNNAHLAKPLRKISGTDMDAIREHIEDLEADGGTRMSAGMDMATELYGELEEIDPTERENRIIFLTDAMPNLGRTGGERLGKMFENNAEEGIYTTFVGMGVDFNTELVETVNKTRGANHYAVHSPGEFRNRMDRDFEFMVTPLVFDLQLNLEAEGYSIEKVYGSPEAEEATDTLMKVKTLFPSRTKEGKTRGGVVLLKLRREDDGEGHIELSASYEDRTGEESEVTREVEFAAEDEDFYDNTGIRKAILLSRYAELLRNWATDQRKALKEDDEIEPVVTPERGIPICPPRRPRQLGEWERKSVPLEVSGTYSKVFTGFLRHLQEEMKALEDDNLEQEVKILEKLSKKGGE
ncbi:MAG: vWA domain-containing protein, partial [Candidatus Brocadiia bacterium]